MKQKEGFSRMSIADMKAIRDKKEMEHKVNTLLASIDRAIEEEAEKLAQELVNEGFDENNFEIQVDHELANNKLIVNFKVIQLAKTIEYELK